MLRKQNSMKMTEGMNLIFRALSLEIKKRLFSEFLAVIYSDELTDEVYQLVKFDQFKGKWTLEV